MAAALKNDWGFLMRRPMLGCLLALTALQVFAAGFGFKPEQRAKLEAMLNVNGGNHSSFEFSCSTNGNTTNGRGESTSAGDTHVMHVETEMKFLGADCGNVKPMTPPKASP
jgi:hypothetical protein